MSVLLTACRKSKQNAIEKALKKKAEDKKARREAKEARMLAYQADQGMPSMHTECHDTTVWNFMISEETFNISFRMYTGEVFCNGEKMDAMETFAEEDCSCTYDFAMNGHKGRIVTRDGTPNTLTVDGMLVPNW